MKRRELLRLLSQATLLALAALGADGCGGGSNDDDTPPPTQGNPAMPDEAELSRRLDTARALLDDAAQKRQLIADPAASAQLATQIAVGNAILVLAERLTLLVHQESDTSANIAKVDRQLSDISGYIGTISRK